MLGFWLAGAPSSDEFFLRNRTQNDFEWSVAKASIFQTLLEMSLKKGFDPKNIPIYLKLANS